MVSGAHCMKIFIKEGNRNIMYCMDGELILTMEVNITLTHVLLWLNKSSLPQLLSRSI